MKNLTFFATLALVAVLSTQAVAASPTSLYDVIYGSATTSLSVKATNMQTQTMNVLILNEDDDILVNEDFTNKPDFFKKYELSKLKDGQYQLIITKQNSRITQPFSIDGGYVQLSESEKQTTHFPRLNFRQTYFDVNVLSEKYENIHVNVLNAQNEAIFNDKISETHKLHKRYFVDKLPYGDYRVEVIVNGEAFYYDFKK